MHALLSPSKAPQGCRRVKSCLCAVGPVNFYVPLMWEAAEAGVSVGSKWVYGQQIKKETAEATERDVPSNFCNITVVDAGEVHGEQMAETAGLICCLLPLLESALA